MEAIKSRFITAHNAIVEAVCKGPERERLKRLTEMSDLGQEQHSYVASDSKSYLATYASARFDRLLAASDSL
ncbi:hypothetical protein, partial [Paraburkholderia sediminicola]|uniref:hypothetical protein n=1 Tax=Paraburkholderia sediminicola TaxID=458836 RepID=UPI0038BDB447